ncbi:protein of unknown function [Pseudonocardia thermophila]|uniref:DNA repair ATPase n=1 Tax=Pseudonocardia thermophila TaxID=1848 RepID=A0A1M6QV98_PSETH|nr:protein of unknown function [Pseudonocardia thermophila]
MSEQQAWSGTLSETGAAEPSAAATNEPEAATPDAPPAPEQPEQAAPQEQPAAQQEQGQQRPPRPAPPKPRPKRHVVPAPATAPEAIATLPPCTVPTASEDPHRWGRVDADGNIFLFTPDGERRVGSWQAGSPEEGLAHFARRFDDILTEVELLFARLVAGGDPRSTMSSARSIKEGLHGASVIGDMDGLAARIDELIAYADKAAGAARSARDAQRAEATARKEALVAEAEALAAESTQWKQAGDRFKAILEEWRTIRGVDRKTDEVLWRRFSKAREAFNRRRGSHFAELDRQRAAAKARKEELAAEAEALADSEDWSGTAARFRELMTEWKAAGRAHKEADDALWQRFRTAQDTFFQRRAAVFAERDAEYRANAEKKRALLDEAEKIDLSDPDAARAALRSIQERWEEIGKVPREDIRPLDARLRAVEEKVREAVERQWRRTDPEAEARVAQFRDRVAQFEAQAAKAEAAGDKRRAEQARAQAEQWREWLRTAEAAIQER